MMKKLISLILALTLVLALAMPGFAYDTQWISASRSDIPVIRISGDGEPLVDENGNKVFHYKDFGALFEDDEEEDQEDNSELFESIANILMPFLFQGIIQDNWEPYYENLQKEIGELFETSLLDKNGNAQYGTGLRQFRKDGIKEAMTKDQAWWDGSQKYYVQDRYYWRYDWRLDPCETADEFKKYLDGVMSASGSREVGIMATCLGTNVITAYLAEYPEHAAEHVRGICYNGNVVKGAEMLSEAISGKFNVDAAAINRCLADCNSIGLFDVDGFINSTLEMLDRTGILDSITDLVKEDIYYKLVEGVTSALALSTFYTWPNYWACVSKDDYDTAIHYVFGDEGSAKRQEYAGLIAKLDNYNVTVRQRADEVIKAYVAAGGHFGVISKYGFQNLPICETNDLISDQFATVRRSSFGATTSTIYDTLSDEYIASHDSRYISPDKQIDASTCLFPDSTWFIKGSSHSNWSDYEIRLMYNIASAKTQLKVGDEGTWPSQFVVYQYPDENSGLDDCEGEIYKMTEENCHTENWEADTDMDFPQTEGEKRFVGLLAFLNWFIDLLLMIFR